MTLDEVNQLGTFYFKHKNEDTVFKADIQDRVYVTWAGDDDVVPYTLQSSAEYIEDGTWIILDNVKTVDTVYAVFMEVCEGFYEQLSMWIEHKEAVSFLKSSNKDNLVIFSKDREIV